MQTSAQISKRHSAISLSRPHLLCDSWASWVCKDMAIRLYTVYTPNLWQSESESGHFDKLEWGTVAVSFVHTQSDMITAQALGF